MNEPASPQRPTVALVTGAVGGLGRACCAMLADAGAHVIVGDLDEDGANALSRELCAAGGSASAVGLDVRERVSVDAAIEDAVSTHGRIDVLVNLAGALRNQTLVKIEDSDFELVMATHVHGVLNTMRAAVPTMRANRYGRIVNTSSIAVRGSIAGSAYGAAKGAIEALTRSAAMEVAAHGITVNCVGPGLINAGMFLTVDQAYQDEVAARVPMGRLGEPDDVAACVRFLASEEARYVTGQTLVVCGGLSLGF
jgi:3-oxoacyl-[acyl-carrier protein] reductase